MQPGLAVQSAVLVFPWHQQNSGIVCLQQRQAARAVPRRVQIPRNVICVHHERMGCFFLQFLAPLAVVYLHVIYLESSPHLQLLSGALSKGSRGLSHSCKCCYGQRELKYTWKQNRRAGRGEISECEVLKLQ